MANLPKSISLSINLDKIEDQHIIQGQKGRYLDIRMFLSENNEYGNDYMAVQGVSKEKREAGERGPILGNAKAWKDDYKAPQGGGSTSAPADTSSASDAMPF